MKDRLLIFIFLCSLLACREQGLRPIKEEALIDLIVDNKLPSPENVILKSASGEIISLDSLQKLELTGNYTEDYYVDGSGEIKEIVIRKKTLKDEAFLAKLSQRLNRPPVLKKVEIDCADKVNILQRAYENDQRNRMEGTDVDPETEHQNLEIIVSFLEKCGMPTLDEVNYIQMAGIWLVLQHAHPQYQKKYIPLIEKAAANGDINYGVVATMKDRALMHDGKAQIYGTQVKDGKLYYLENPEYVDQRRKEIGLEPLAEYLFRFSIEFDVPQKQK